MTNFNTIFNQYQKLINDKLIEIANLSSPKSMREPFLYLIENGGKRLRPILTMLSCGAVGGNPISALNSGVSLEILHNFTLVHDDIMDSAPLRRGRDTVHIKWDNSTAILVGDLMIGYALKLLSNDNLLVNKTKILELFADALVIVCEGQALDMDYNSNKEVSVSEYIEMIQKKTTNLIRASVLMGAHCGDANNEQIEILNEFAINLGLAFQIQDDYLDLTSQVSGKVIGQDLIEGKKTYMIIRAKEIAFEPEDIELINLFYKNNGVKLEQIPEMLNLLQKLSILDEAKNLFYSYYENAEISLNKLEKNNYTIYLTEILKLTKNRNN